MLFKTYPLHARLKSSPGEDEEVSVVGGLMVKKIVKSALGLSFLLMTACAGEPKSILDQLIKEKNFIPFELPMESTRVGTMLRGNANEMYLVARPEKCFPDLEGDDSLRWLQSTTLPQQYQRIEFSANVDVNAVLGIGNDTVKVKSQLHNVKTIEIQFKGAMVEFLEEGNFLRYHDAMMSQECRNLLKQSPFIAQGLRIESMRFVFKDEQKGEINLIGKVQEYVDIAAGVKWHIEDNYSLIIETPKYIGYRMGKLETVGDAKSILYASTTNGDGEWLFKRLDEIRVVENKSSNSRFQPQVQQKLSLPQLPKIFKAEPLF